MLNIRSDNSRLNESHIWYHNVSEIRTGVVCRAHPSGLAAAGPPLLVAGDQRRHQHHQEHPKNYNASHSQSSIAAAYGSAAFGEANKYESVDCKPAGRKLQ